MKPEHKSAVQKDAWLKEVLNLEQSILDGKMLSAEQLLAVPEEIRLKSPLLLRAECENGLLGGRLAETQLLLETALKGFAAQADEASMLTMMGMLGLLYEQAGDRQESQTFTGLLRQEWSRSPKSCSGFVPWALAREEANAGAGDGEGSGHDFAVSDELFLSAAERFREEGRPLWAGFALLDRLLFDPLSVSEPQWQLWHHWLSRNLTEDRYGGALLEVLKTKRASVRLSSRLPGRYGYLCRAVLLDAPEEKPPAALVGDIEVQIYAIGAKIRRLLTADDRSGMAASLEMLQRLHRLVSTPATQRLVAALDEAVRQAGQAGPSVGNAAPPVGHMPAAAEANAVPAGVPEGRGSAPSGMPEGTAPARDGMPAEAATMQAGEPAGTASAQTGTSNDAVPGHAGTPARTVSPRAGISDEAVPGQAGEPAGTASAQTGMPDEAVPGHVGTPAGTAPVQADMSDEAVPGRADTPAGTAPAQAGMSEGAIPERTVSPQTGMPDESVPRQAGETPVRPSGDGAAEERIASSLPDVQGSGSSAEPAVAAQASESSGSLPEQPPAWAGHDESGGPADPAAHAAGPSEGSPQPSARGAAGSAADPARGSAADAPAGRSPELSGGQATGDAATPERSAAARSRIVGADGQALPAEEARQGGARQARPPGGRTSAGAGERESPPERAASPASAVGAERWRIKLFDGIRFGLPNGTEIQPVWKRRKAGELLAYLLLQPGYKANRNLVIERVFGEGDASKRSNQLYVTLHDLRQSMKEAGISDDPVYAKGGVIAVDEQAIDYVDAETYLTLSRVGDQLWMDDREAACRLYEKALPLYGHMGRELPHAEWLDRLREQLLDRQTNMLKRAAAYYSEQHDDARAEQYISEWIALRPQQEEAYESMIRHCLAKGGRTEAIGWYRRLERICQEELGTEPIEEIRRLLWK